MWSMILSNISKIIPGFTNLVKKEEPKQMKSKKQKEVKTTAPKKKEPKWQTWFPFTLVYGNGKIQPLYLLAWLLISLLVTFEGVKIFAAWKAIKSGGYTPDHLPTADFGLLIGLVPTIILLYNKTKKTDDSNDSNPPS